MKGIPLTIILALAAAAAESVARSGRAGTAPQVEACDCPDCNARKATNELIEARGRFADAQAKRNAAHRALEDAEVILSNARGYLISAQQHFDCAADALNAEEAKAEGGAQ